MHSHYESCRRGQWRLAKCWPSSSKESLPPFIIVMWSYQARFTKMVIPCSFFNLLSSAFLFPVGVHGALWIETCLVRSSLLLIRSALLIRSTLLLIRSTCLIKSTWNIFCRWSVSTEFCLHSSPRNRRSASRTFVSSDICFRRPICVPLEDPFVSIDICFRRPIFLIRSACLIKFVSTDICFPRPSRRRSLILEPGKFPETTCSKLWLERVRAIFGNFKASIPSTLTLCWHFREAFKSAFLQDTVLRNCLWKGVIVGKRQISGIQQEKSRADIATIQIAKKYCTAMC